MNGEVTISKDECLRLLLDSACLGLLEAGGVDNWDWYGDSLSPDDGDGIEEATTRLTAKVEAM